MNEEFRIELQRFEPDGEPIGAEVEYPIELLTPLAEDGLTYPDWLQAKEAERAKLREADAAEVAALEAELEVALSYEETDESKELVEELRHRIVSAKTSLARKETRLNAYLAAEASMRRSRHIGAYAATHWHDGEPQA